MKRVRLLVDHATTLLEQELAIRLLTDVIADDKKDILRNQLVNTVPNSLVFVTVTIYALKQIVCYFRFICG